MTSGAAALTDSRIAGRHGKSKNTLPFDGSKATSPRCVKKKAQRRPWSVAATHPLRSYLALANRLRQRYTPDPKAQPAQHVSNDLNKPLEITIVPGKSVPAMLRIQRNGHDDLVTFTVENLPHGVIVDNIGLNGVLIPKGENDRQIFLSAAKWVPEQDRLCYAVENQAGRQTSLPILLHVRKQPPR